MLLEINGKDTREHDRVAKQEERQAAKKYMGESFNFRSNQRTTN